MIFKYKKINQNYVDLWRNGKSKIKIMNRIFILNVIYSLIEKKKSLLLQKYTRDKRLKKRRAIKRMFFPLMEYILKNIPSKYMDVNRKTRIYKYIKRKNKQLFQPQEKLFSELIFILRRKRKKPTWRATPFENYLKRKQIISQYYGNIPLRWFKNNIRKNKYYLASAHNKIKEKKTEIMLYQTLENRLDTVLYKSFLFPSFSLAKQYISHKNVLVNDKVITSGSHILKIGDVVTLKKNMMLNNCLHNKYMNSVIFYFMCLKHTGFFYNKKKNKSFYSEMMNIIKQNEVLKEEDMSNVGETYSDMALDLNVIDKNSLFYKFLFTTKKNSSNLLMTSNKDSVYLLNTITPTNIQYPFEFKKEDFSVLINYLNK